MWIFGLFFDVLADLAFFQRFERANWKKDLAITGGIVGIVIIPVLLNTFDIL